MRLLMETDTGVLVSDGHGWREPHEGEFVSVDGGNFLSLNGERAAIAWLKGAFAGSAVTAVVVAMAFYVWVRG